MDWSPGPDHDSLQSPQWEDTCVPYHKSQVGLGLHATSLRSLRTLPSSSPHSRTYRLTSQLPYSLLRRFDRTETLGGFCGGKLIGHTGCVNALSWSSNGELLASGSDDTRVLLWKVGGRGDHPHADLPEDASDSEDEEENGGLEQDGTTGHIRMPRRARRSILASIRSRERRSEKLAARPGNNDAGINHQLVTPVSPTTQHTSLQMGLQHQISTGHRANIFSVKFAPASGNARLFTAAGDAQVRVFDLSRYSAVSNQRAVPDGREWTAWNEEGADPESSSSCCVRVYRCHRSRAKRIATEASPDTFLSASEDGTVRQMDLRVPHSCSRSRDAPYMRFGNYMRGGAGGGDGSSGCPRPLCMHEHMDLYSLSVSKLEPHLFVVAGTSEYAYLHDRRMVRTLIQRDWGHVPAPRDEDGAGALTQVVRKFGLPGAAQTGKRSATMSGAADEDTGEEDADGWDERMEALRRDSGGARASRAEHITAAKISENRSAELLCSYSELGIFRYNLKSGDVERAYLHPPSPAPAAKKKEAGLVSAAVQALREEEEEETMQQIERRQQRLVREGSAASRSSGSSDGSTVESALARRAERRAEHLRAREEIHPNESPTSRQWWMNRLEQDGYFDSDIDPSDADEDDDDEDEDDEEDSDYSDYSSAGRVRGGPGPEAPLVRPMRRFTGHRNVQTVKDVNWAGPNDEWVVSGSDDGNWFAWDADTGEIVGIWKGDGAVVNVLQPHPYLPVSGDPRRCRWRMTIASRTPLTPIPHPHTQAIAISGIDNSVKVFSPVGMTQRRKTSVLADEDEIVERNTRGGAAE